MEDELSIDEVHYLISDVEESLSLLKGQTGDIAESWRLAGLTSAFLELYGGHIHYGSPEARELGVPPKLANALFKENAKIRLSDAIILGNRLLSKLHTLESEFGGEFREREPDPPATEKAESDAVFDKASGGPSEYPSAWAIVPSAGPIKLKIAQISQLLDDIAYAVRSSNLPESERALSDIERAQLIAVLETVLKLLKAPMVERGLLQKCGDWLAQTSKRVAQKQSEETLGSLAEKAFHELREFIDQFPWDGTP